MSTVLGGGVGLFETESEIQGQVQGGKAFRRTKEKGSCRLWNVDPCINAPTQINPISKHLKERTGCLSVILKSLVVVLSKNYRHYFASINLKMWSSTQYKNRETISCYAKVYTIHCSVHCVKISLDVLICWTHPDSFDMLNPPGQPQAESHRQHRSLLSAGSPKQSQARLWWVEVQYTKIFVSWEAVFFLCKYLYWIWNIPIW